MCVYFILCLFFHSDSEQLLTSHSVTSIRHYIQNLDVIDNEKKLTQLSRAIEHWNIYPHAVLSPATYWGRKSQFLAMMTWIGIDDWGWLFMKTFSYQCISADLSSNALQVVPSLDSCRNYMPAFLNYLYQLAVAYYILKAYYTETP